ncbi:hypothetical protein LBMAG41_29500 [Cyanobium sp.]|nr:hypothetical protein LBMAG41_29500 [Cyanobium sp.]
MRAGLAGLVLAADLQGGLIEQGAHLGLLLRRSLRLEQGQGLGDVGGAEHGALEVLKLLVEIGVAGGVLPR